MSDFQAILERDRETDRILRTLAGIFRCSLATIPQRVNTLVDDIERLNSQILEMKGRKS